ITSQNGQSICTRGNILLLTVPYLVPNLSTLVALDRTLTNMASKTSFTQRKLSISRSGNHGSRVPLLLAILQSLTRFILLIALTTTISTLKVGNGYPRKGQKRSQNDKTEHENRKSVKKSQNQSQNSKSQSQPRDKALERAWKKRT
ncbi:hypothetical protein Tco_0193349, partial [Tanacetum coccineum]